MLTSPLIGASAPVTSPKDWFNWLTSGLLAGLPYTWSRKADRLPLRADDGLMAAPDDECSDFSSSSSAPSDAGSAASTVSAVRSSSEDSWPPSDAPSSSTSAVEVEELDAAAGACAATSAEVEGGAAVVSSEEGLMAKASDASTPVAISPPVVSAARMGLITPLPSSDALMIAAAEADAEASCASGSAAGSLEGASSSSREKMTGDGSRLLPLSGPSASSSTSRERTASATPPPAAAAAEDRGDPSTLPLGCNGIEAAAQADEAADELRDTRASVLADCGSAGGRVMTELTTLDATGEPSCDPDSEPGPNPPPPVMTEEGRPDEAADVTEPAGPSTGDVTPDDVTEWCDDAVSATAS